MTTYRFGVQPFMTTTFTSPITGSSDSISANTLADFTIDGNGGQDVVSTGAGNDTITTTAGNDKIAAGSGNNTVSAGDGTNSVTTGSGNDSVTTGTGNDVIAAGDGNNTVDAGDGTNGVTTGGGDDIIVTGGGADNINAGAGNDMINAGGGADSLIGGGGHDTFIYGSLADARLGADTISDFGTSSPRVAGEGDLLILSGLVHDFTGTHGRASLAKLVDSGHISFSGDSETTVISFDSNGHAAGGSVGVLVTLVGVAFTTAGDAVLAFSDNITV